MSDIPLICKKRIMGDQKIFDKHPHKYIVAYPDEKNILLWHYMFIGPEGTPYENGHYIGEIIHDKNYPYSPPDLKMLTPSGRFEINTIICATHAHKSHLDEWSPIWNTKTILDGFLSLMTSTDYNDNRGIAHTTYDDDTRRKYAKQSHDYNKQNHKNVYQKLLEIYNEQKGKI